MESDHELISIFSLPLIQRKAVVGYMCSQFGAVVRLITVVDVNIYDTIPYQSKKISNDQELIQSDPTSCP